MQEKQRAMTAFDWGICVLLALIAIAAAYFALRTRGDQGQKHATVTYTVRIAGTDASLLTDASMIAAGDAVFSENGTLPLGTVTRVQTAPHRRAVVRDGEIILTDVPQRIDLDVTVSGMGSYTSGRGWRISEVRVAAGETGSFCIGGYYAARATVIDVSVSENSGNGAR